MSDFYYFFTDERLLKSDKLDIHNSCPHCSIVNQPTIIGYIEYPEYVEKWFKSYANDFYEIFTSPLEEGEEFDENRFQYELKEHLNKVFIDVVYQCSGMSTLNWTKIIGAVA